MRILFVADVSIQRVIGGAERVLFEQTTRLAERGHRVYVITRRMSEHLQTRETLHGVHEFRCQFDAGKPARLLFETWPEVKRQFARLQKQIQFDCLNIHQPNTAYPVLRVAAKLNIPMVYTCHSLAFEEYFSRHPLGTSADRSVRWLNAMARRWIEQRVLRRCHRVVALSDYTVEKLRCAYSIQRDCVDVIPGGVDLVKFQPVVDKKALRRCMGIPVDAFILLTVRNLEPRMGIENLLEAIKIVNSRTNGFYLIVGGAGSLESELRAHVERSSIADYVRFTGFIPEKDLPRYYQMADLFVLPTQELEGFGMVTLEALACGLPVLGTPVGGTLEILGGLDRHLLFKDCRPESIAAGILSYYQRTADSPGGAAEISKNCRRFTETHYSWETNITALETVFENARRSSLS